MTKIEKNGLIEQLSLSFKESSAIAVCDYKGLTVKHLENLRNKARASDISVRVVKNTLAKIALTNAGYQNVELLDTNVMLWGKDQVVLSKLILDFSKENNDEKFKVKFGYMDGSLVNKEQIDAISKLPSREQLIGMLLSTWMAPVQNMASVLIAPIRNFATVLSNIEKQKSESSES